MKKNILKIIPFFILLLISSCEKAEELPPVKEGYATEYIMPEASFLTDEDRAFIEAQQTEYEESIK